MKYYRNLLIIFLFIIFLCSCSNSNNTSLNKTTLSEITGIQEPEFIDFSNVSLDEKINIVSKLENYLIENNLSVITSILLLSSTFFFLKKLNNPIPFLLCKYYTTQTKKMYTK